MINSKLKITITLLGITVFAAGSAIASEINVTVKNLTNGIYFTPLLISAHSGKIDLFETGQAASAELQAMAEGGDISGLSALLGGPDKDTVENPAGGLLGPGDVVEDIQLKLKGHRNRYLSIVAMMLPTNDGFIGLDSQRIPRWPGTYRYFMYGYDAGTEANDELITGGGAPGAAGIPAAPGGDAGEFGSGVIDFDTNETVHIHRGNLGDNDPEGGISDLDSAIHRWLNPVAEVVVKVFPSKRWK